MYATTKSQNQPHGRTLPLVPSAARQSTFPRQVVDLTFLTLQFYAQTRLSNLKLALRSALQPKKLRPAFRASNFALGPNHARVSPSAPELQIKLQIVTDSLDVVSRAFTCQPE